MGQYFRGWRRKIGVATLLLALACAGAWVRSLSLKDEFTLRSNPRVTRHFISNRSRVAWKTMTIGEPFVRFINVFYFANPAAEQDFYWGTELHWEWRWKFAGFEFGRRIPNGPPWHEDIWIIPYWSFTVPLTILAGYLLLKKPQQSLSAPDTSHTSTTV